MKKFLDAFVLKSIWRQLFLALIVGLVVVVFATPIAQIFIAPESLYNTFHSSWLWSLLHLCDGGSLQQTIVSTHESSDEVAGTVAMLVAFIVWLVGTVLLCFVTGAIANAFEVRKEKIANGLVRYGFSGDHGIIIGWDFQGVPIVEAMKELFQCKEIVVLTSQTAETIRNELSNELSEEEMKNIFIWKGNIFDKSELIQLEPYKAKFIVILGDQSDNNNDAENYRTFECLAKLHESYITMKNSIKTGLESGKIPCFIDILNPYNLWQDEIAIRTLPSPYFVPHILNFYKQSANELLTSMFSIYSYNKGRRHGVYEYTYMPLAFRRNPEASHVHIIVSGFDDMAHMYIIQAIKILQPAKEDHVISIFSDHEDAVKRFLDFYDFNQLQNIRLLTFRGSVCTRENRQHVINIVRDLSASVTLLIANPKPADAMEEFHRLPSELNFENIHIIIEQQVMTAKARNTYSLRRKGYSTVDYIGLVDKFYYSLLKQDAFVDKLTHDDENISIRFIDNKRRFIDTFLEKLYALDLIFDMCVDENNTPLQQLHEDIEQLARAEHPNYVNKQALTGFKYDTATNDRHFSSSVMKPWNNLEQAQRDNFKNEILTILPAINEMFGKESADLGNIHYGIFKQRFRTVLGFVDNSDSTLNWNHGNDANNLYHAIVKSLWAVIRVSKRTNDNEICNRYPSTAILCTLEDDANAMIIDMAKRQKIPTIAFLPQKPEQFQYRFKETRDRESFWKRLRNVYTYYVLPEGIPNEKQFIEAVIAKYSDEIWHVGDFSVPDSTVETLKMDIRFLEPRSKKPTLRKIENSPEHYLSPAFSERDTSTALMDVLKI